MWDRELAPTGQRAVVSFGVGRMDQPWHGGQPGFYLKESPDLGDATGRFADLFEHCSPRQLRLCLGFPMPGDPLWTSDFLGAMAHRFHGFDRTPYDTAREERQGDGVAGLSEAEAQLASPEALRRELARLRGAAL